ncbi:hypothetical protein Tco_0162963 [Tanacetum coccineum]
MLQQRHGESLSKAWTRFKELLQKVPHHGIDLWLQVQIFYDHVNLAKMTTIDQSASGNLHDRNAEESWALLKGLALYDKEIWNDPRDFAKPVNAISLPQDFLITFDCRLIELENQVQRLMEAYLAPKPSVQDARLSKFEVDFKQQQGEMTSKIDTGLKAINDQIIGALLSDAVKNPKLNVNSASLVLSAHSYPMEGPQCSSHIHNSINVIKMNLSSPKCVHFINSVTILNKEDEPRDAGIVKPDTKNDDHDTIVKAEKESEEEEGREEIDDSEYINTNPPPPNPLNSFIIEKVYLEIKHTKSVHFRNEEDKRKGLEYVMSKILWFYKECLELGPEYLTGLEDEG